MLKNKSSYGEWLRDVKGDPSSLKIRGGFFRPRGPSNLLLARVIVLLYGHSRLSACLSTADALI
jgi:hypothetical protein